MFEAVKLSRAMHSPMEYLIEREKNVDVVIEHLNMSKL
jgi:hypothetical protein